MLDAVGSDKPAPAAPQPVVKLHAVPQTSTRTATAPRISGSASAGPATPAVRPEAAAARPTAGAAAAPPRRAATAKSAAESKAAAAGADRLSVECVVLLLMSVMNRVLQQPALYAVLTWCHPAILTTQSWRCGGERSSGFVSCRYLTTSMTRRRRANGPQRTAAPRLQQRQRHCHMHDRGQAPKPRRRRIVTRRGRRQKILWPATQASCQHPVRQPQAGARKHRRVQNLAPQRFEPQTARCQRPGSPRLRVNRLKAGPARPERALLRPT